MLATTTWPITRLPTRSSDILVRATRPAAPVRSHRGTHCATCPSRAQSAWCSLDGPSLGGVDAVKTSNVYQPGQALFYQGNPSLGLYCIESGTVAVRKTDAAGNSIIVRLAHAGDTLGYRAFFAGEALQASAEALEPSRVCFIDKSAVRRLLDQNPALGLVFLQRLAQDVARAHEAQLHAATLSVRARLGHLLLVLKDRFGVVDDAGDLVLHLPLSRQDMAAMIGTRPETIARAVRSLEDEGIAHFEGRVCRVPDLDALLDAVELS
jgi:CRP-like cAMP-binding protein